MSESKTPESQETKPVLEIDEQTQKHIDRFLEGTGAWNSWATSKLKEKKKLKKEGKWKVRYGVDKKLNWRYMSADHNNPEIQNWLDETYVDFSFITFTVKEFQKKAYEENFRIPKMKFFPKAPHKNKIIKVDTNNIDFERFIFPNGVDFTCCMFWGDANFYKTKFYEKAIFLNCNFNRHTHFRRARFYDAADFNISYFYSTSDFSSARFYQNATFLSTNFKMYSEFEFAKFLGFRSDFSKVHFEETVSFWKSVFNGNVSFSESLFDENAYFNAVKFRNEAIFDSVKFNGVARFFETCFYEYVSFNNTLFNKQADFSVTKFYERSRFEAMRSKQAFNLTWATFVKAVPDFNQANFLEAPRFDNVQIIEPIIKSSRGNWVKFFWRKRFAFYLKWYWCKYIWQHPKHIWNKFRNKRRNPDEEAHYRALKRLAIQAHDHENEMKFFTGEIRARRHVTDFANFLTHDFASSMHYWAGVAYELFSDFGRSFIRPTLWWFACLWLFANLTLSGAGLVDETKCHNSQLTPKEAAYTIGLKNSLLILGLTKTNIVKQAELCLYGKNKNGEAESKPKPYDPKIKRTYQAKSAKVENTKTDIPFKAAVQGIFHSGLSLLFIFLLLLAIRNQFKIK